MHAIPSASGIYVVSLSNEDPISVNAHRSYAQRCIFVTKANCKFGRAQNLARRYRDYVKTFGAEHVTFEVVVLIDSPSKLEAAVSVRLSDFRIRGLTGRLNEWLVGTTPANVKLMILEVASELLTPVSSSVSPSQSNRPIVQMAQVARESSSKIVEAARYLRNAGMSVQLLKDLHHFKSRTETYTSTIQYFGLTRDLRSVNVAYGARLLYVEQAHRSGRGPFESLIVEAHSHFPLSAGS